MAGTSRPRSARSAGLLMYRRGPDGIELFLVHPGGPLFAGRDHGVWSIPKGESAPGEDSLAVARREFSEEAGLTVESCRRGAGGFLPLGSIQQRGGKTVEAWAFEGDWPAGRPVTSNTFTMEWPPGSGRRQEFPEVDRGQFFPAVEARKRINPAQAELIDRLLALLGAER